MEASKAFVATLPESIMSDELERIRRWGKDTCEKHSIVMGSKGEMRLVCVKKGPPKSVREYQRSLLTCLTNWGVQKNGRRTGWLVLIDESEFDTHAYPERSRCALHTAIGPEKTFHLPQSLLRAR